MARLDLKAQVRYGPIAVKRDSPHSHGPIMQPHDAGTHTPISSLDVHPAHRALSPPAI
jgi:hypothetical protein